MKQHSLIIPGDSPTPVNYTTFESASRGEHVVITGGVHGDELVSTAVVQRIIEVLETYPLRQGRVTCVPIVNTKGSEDKVRTLGIDGPDLNRCFGSANNPNALADALSSEILLQATRVVDVHDAGSDDILWPHSRYFAEDAISTKMAHEFGTSIIIPREGKPGMMSTYLREHNIPSLTVEAGGGRVMKEEDIAFAVEGILRILYGCGMVDKEIVCASPFTPEIYRYRYGFVSQLEGSPLLKEDVVLGEVLNAGHQAGMFTDIEGKTHQLDLPLTGKVFSLWLNETVTPGRVPPERIMSIVTQENYEVSTDTDACVQFVHMPM